jgi:hypothetical protein
MAVKPHLPLRKSSDAHVHLANARTSQSRDDWHPKCIRDENVRLWQQWHTQQTGKQIPSKIKPYVATLLHRKATNNPNTANNLLSRLISMTNRKNGHVVTTGRKLCGKVVPNSLNGTRRSWRSREERASRDRNPKWQTMIFRGAMDH